MKATHYETRPHIANYLVPELPGMFAVTCFYPLLPDLSADLQTLPAQFALRNILLLVVRDTQNMRQRNWANNA